MMRRAKWFLIPIIPIVIFIYLFKPYLLEPVSLLYIFIIFGFFVITVFVVGTAKIFDFIENISSLEYSEIRPDNGFYAYLYLFIYNFLIAIISIFLLYTINNSSDFLIEASTSIVILIRSLAYFKNEIAKEIGKGFRYAILPLGFALFLWDFLSPLMQKDPLHPYLPVHTFIRNEYQIFLILIFSLFLITCYDPVLGILVNKLKKYF